jgi:hypothetical protein
MTAAIAPARTNNPNGRPSNAQLADRLERSRLRNVLLAEELRALAVERQALGTEIGALSRRIDLAIRADRPDVAMHVAGRLDALASSLTRRGAA